MRRPDGTSKGCAFIKFQQLESALLAIRALNAQAYILGSDQPIEVRFAENKKKPAPTTTQTTPTTHRPYGTTHPTSMNHPTYPPWGGMAQRPPPVTYIRYHTPEGTPYFYNTITQVTQWEEPPAGSLVYVEEWGNAPYYIPGGFDKPPVETYPTQPTVKKPGPAGANLFIFHLPNEWSKVFFR